LKRSDSALIVRRFPGTSTGITLRYPLRSYQSKILDDTGKSRFPCHCQHESWQTPRFICPCGLLCILKKKKYASSLTRRHSCLGRRIAGKVCGTEWVSPPNGGAYPMDKIVYCHKRKFDKMSRAVVAMFAVSQPEGTDTAES